MADLQVVIRALNQASSELRKVASDLNHLDRAAQKAGTGATKANAGFGKFNSILTATGLQSSALGGQLSHLTTGIGGVGVAAGVAAVSVGALAAGIGASVKAAIDFEKSFARIKKTVDGTDAEFASLAQANRDLAKELGINVNEINRIGEIAGQLGVAVGGVDDFSKSIAELNITTGVAVDQLASSFGTLVSVLGVPIEEVDRLGSALTALGNNFNSTEAAILEFSTRFAGAAKVLGIGVADVAGISNAFASVGVEAERGGTAVQKILFELQKAAAGTGEEAIKTANLFAALTGQTTEQFRSLLKTDPTEVFVRFIEGLEASGDKAIPVLEALGLADARVAAAALSAAGANDLLRRSIDTSTNAALTNTATQIEVAKQLDTTAAQFNILKANVNDIAISIGQFFNPAVRDVITGLNALITAVRESDEMANLRANLVLLGQGIEFVAAKVEPVIQALSALKAKFDELPGPVKAVATVIAAVLLAPLTAIIATVSLFTADWAAAWAKVAGVINAVVNPILKVGTEIVNVVGGIGLAAGKLAASWAANWQEIVGAVASVVARFNPIATAVIGGMASIANAAAGLAGGWGNVWDSIKGTIQSAGSVIESILQRIADAIASAGDFIDEFIGKINGVSGKLGGVLGKVGVELPELPTLNLKAPQISLGGGGGVQLGGAQFGDELAKLGEQFVVTGEETSKFSFDLEALLAALAALTGGGGASGGGGGSGGGIPKAIAGMQELAAAFDAWHAATGGSIEGFVATIELAQEQTQATAGLTEESFRARVELSKLAIVLGKAGITGESFVAQQQLESLADAYRKSGMSTAEFVDALNGFTSAMLDRARDLARASGKNIHSFSYGQGANDIVVGDTRYSGGGNATDEGFEKIIKDLPPDAQEEARAGRKTTTPTDPYGGDAWGAATTNNYYGPVTTTYTSSDRRELSFGLR